MAASAKKQIIDGNVSKLDKIISDTLEKRAYHITEMAESVLNEPVSEGDYSANDAFAYKQKECYCIEENKQYVSAVQNGIRLFDRLMYVDKYCKKKDGGLFSNAANAFEKDTVVYLKNPLTDIAYSTFSMHLNDPRVSYRESFADVCEDVYYNKAPYCILPLENYEDGRLSSFFNMIRKYELKIVLSCNVESANGKITKFALLKRDITKLTCNETSRVGEYLEIGFNFGEKAKLNEVLTAASYFGFELNKINSLPIYYSEKEYYFDVVFNGEGDLEKLIYWLELEIPRYEILGIYTEIKTI